MASVSQVVTFGYIRNVQSLIHVTIPIEIYDLCCLYHAKFSSIIFKKFSNNTNGWELGIIDTEQKEATIIDLNGQDKSMSFACCQIPNISSILPKQMCHGKRSLNGIFGLKSAHPYLILYDCLYNRNKDTIYSLYQYTSSSSIKKSISPQDFLYCGINNGIIYEHEGNLYQFKLTEIKSETDFTDNTIFKELSQKNKKFDLVDNAHKIQYLKMQYLERNNSIFAVQNHDNDRMDMYGMRGTIKSRNVECGLFHIDTGKWSDIPSFQYTKRDNFVEFKCTMCYDGNQSVFMLTQKADFAKFELNKNKWIILNAKSPLHRFRRTQTIWIEEPNIVYCYSVGEIFSYDLRADKQEWIACDWTMDGIPKDVQYCYIMYLDSC